MLFDSQVANSSKLIVYFLKELAINIARPACELSDILVYLRLLTAI